MEKGLCVYVADSRDAATHYCKAFGATIGYNEKFENGGYLHAEIVRDGQTILAVSESAEWATSGLCAQFCLNFGKDNKAALEAAYHTLSEGGRVLYPLGPCDWNACMADLVDRFGVRWYIAL